MAKTKTVIIGYTKRSNAAKELKIEFPGGIVHITTGLTNRVGQQVVNVSVSADGDRFAGNPCWWAMWGPRDERGGGCRIVQSETAGQAL